ncbi:putative disease resistance protein RGA1 [Apium graveolens]|uniref:putative disease resistance protein RGA1 n=1 Tax=Apium graveolens TaxID=4045 RepID=UPI003D7A6FB4
MADAFVADLASGLVFKLISLATDELIQAWNLHEDLVTLRERLETVDALLSDANAKKISMSTVQTWFNKLEAVAHVTDVFFNELTYQVTREKVENHHKVRDYCIPSKNKIIYRLKVARKIKSIHNSFDKLFKSAGDLGLQPLAHLNSILNLREIRQTPPFEDESLIVGRDEDILFLVQTLCKNHEEELPIIALVGMGGQGKTTLARMVYNSDDVMKMFPKRMWVTGSDDFDFMKILNQMAVSLTSTASVLESTEGLINFLQKFLKGVKFLLVVDDVWNEKPEMWDDLRNSLLGVGGARGSNVLITTRKQEVVDAARCSVSYRLTKLSQGDSWALFKNRAFSHGGVLETEEFAAMGRRMVERCGGLPLAIKTLGGLLYSKKSEQEWLLIQNSEMWKSKGVLSSLRLSYDNLPSSSLKRCFAYCSILPKDSVIHINELVEIWMALGFLLPPKGSNLLMEDMGIEYFNILFWNSLLQDVERDEFENITSCRMHDLVHDLALDISKHYSVTVNANHEMNYISGAMYLRLNKGVTAIEPTILKKIFERVHVMYAGANGAYVLPYLKHLTVLVLNSNEITNELPSSLSEMEYLKHLDISLVYRLPSYITELYNLQTLRVRSLQELPKKFCNLINLRHLYIGNPYTRCMFTGIERLTCLQTLPHFVVSKDQNCHLRQLEGLNNLSGKLDLYGLNDVENIEEASKANLCRKSNIQRLLLDWSNNEEERADREYNDEDVMEELRPHKNLKELTVDYFKGKKLASWITMMTNLVKITLRCFRRCERLPPLGHLPKLREIKIIRMDSVKVIGSNFCSTILSTRSQLSEHVAPKAITTYPSLTILNFCGLLMLEEWLEPVMCGDDEDQTTLSFPKLEVLKIRSCFKLKKIPVSCFPSLARLEITNLYNSMILETISRNVSSLTYLRLWNISGVEGNSTNMDSIINELLRNSSPSLTILDLYDCQGLTYLNLGVAVEEIKVSDCPDLKCINIVDESTCLKDLMVERCPSFSEWMFGQSLSSTLVELKLGPFSEESDEFPWPFDSTSSSIISFPNLILLALHGWEKVSSILPAGNIDDRISATFPALTELNIFNFEGLEALPDSLAKLPSLKELFIENCKILEILPTFDESHSLQCLRIYGCPVLTERCMKGSGGEWFKIQHIPYVYLV